MFTILIASTRPSLSNFASTRRLLTEDCGALRRDSPKGTSSCGLSVEEAAGRDPPNKALRGVGVDGGGRGVAVDDCGGGVSRPSGMMNKRVREVRRLALVSLQLAGFYCLAIALCPPPALLLCSLLFLLFSARLLPCRCCLLPCSVCVASFY